MAILNSQMVDFESTSSDFFVQVLENRVSSKKIRDDPFMPYIKPLVFLGDGKFLRFGGWFCFQSEMLKFLFVPFQEGGRVIRSSQRRAQVQHQKKIPTGWWFGTWKNIGKMVV